MKTKPKRTIKIIKPITNPAASTAPRTARKRRMRRKPTLNLNPNLNLDPNPSPSPSPSVSSVPLVVNKSSVGRRHRARPFEPLPELAALPKPDLEHIHELLRTATLAEVQQHLVTTHQIQITISTLHRYRGRLDLADQLQLAQDSAAAVEELLHLFAGRATALSTAGRNVILQRSLGLATAASTSPNLLLQLHRLFTYEDRREAIQHKIKIEKLREKTRIRHAKVAERRQRIVEKNYLDHKPKPKPDPKKQSMMVRRLFGSLPPVTPWPSPEESNKDPKRHTSVNDASSPQNHGRDAFHPRPKPTSRDTITETNITSAAQNAHAFPSPSRGEGQGEGFMRSTTNITSAAQNAPSLNSKSETGNSQLPPPPSSPSAASAPSALNSESVSLATLGATELAKRVDRYTVARMREYLNHDQQYTPWPYAHPRPAYSTELRHCPCGHKCPCPTHESSDLGEFPPIFWKLSPLSLDYETILRDHDLPYRKPTEFLA